MIRPPPSSTLFPYTTLFRSCESTARTAMSHLNDVDAIIFDLRDNRGGEPAMVMLMAAYLFDHPEYMYNPRENTTEQSRSEEHTSELQSRENLVCRLLLEKKK